VNTGLFDAYWSELFLYMAVQVINDFENVLASGVALRGVRRIECRHRYGEAACSVPPCARFAPLVVSVEHQQIERTRDRDVILRAAVQGVEIRHTVSYTPPPRRGWRQCH